MKEKEKISRMSISLKPEEKIKIRILAAKEGMGISKWIREKIKTLLSD